MYFYTVGEPVSYVNGRMVKYVHPAKDAQSVPRRAIYAAVPGEVEAIRQEFIRRKDADEDNIPIRLLSDTFLASNEGFPAKLGRRSLGLDGTSEERSHEFEPEPLGPQLAELRRRKPARQHFRIAIVNGFGTNLGDSLLGATALSVVGKYMRSLLPGVSFDLLLGPGTSAAAADFIRNIPGVERVRWSGISLSDFESYDAYFDFSDLLNLPRYYELPPVDWYIWWMGLEPGAVAPVEKRNRIVIRHDAFQKVRSALDGVRGKKIFFSRRSSVPLRTFPEHEACTFLQGLLDSDESIVAVVEYAIGFDHPRLLDLSGIIDSTEMLKALLALVDGAIVIDSLPLHLTDATALPTVAISASMPADRLVRYYPHACAILLPGAESLPGWGHAKINDQDSWDSMAPAYARAWGGLQPAEVLSTLAEKMASVESLRHGSPPLFEFAVLPERPAWVNVEMRHGHRIDVTPSRIVPSAQAIAAENAIRGIIPQVVFPGCTVVECGGGSGQTALELLRHVGAEGSVYAFEPRRLYFQLLCARSVLAGHDRLYAKESLPYLQNPDGTLPEIADLDMLSPHDDRLQGNSASRVSLRCEPIDDLELPMCRLMVIHPPISVEEALRSAVRTIERCRPIILTAPQGADTAQQLSEHLSGNGYDGWEQQLAPVNAVSASLFVAVPAEMGITVRGFSRIFQPGGQQTA